MRLEFATQGAAQIKANRFHADMIAENAQYARSVSLGHTARWAIPYQDLDAAGVPINTLWWVNVKARVLPTLTAPETAALKPYRT